MVDHEEFDSQEIFERLEPPPGGLSGLRAKISAGRTGQQNRYRTWAAVSASAIAILVVVLVSPLGPYRLTVLDSYEQPSPAFALKGDEHPGLVTLGLRPNPEQPVSIPQRSRTQLAVQKVPLDTDEVLFYFVGSTERKAAESRPVESSATRKDPQRPVERAAGANGRRATSHRTPAELSADVEAGQKTTP